MAVSLLVVLQPRLEAEAEYFQGDVRAEGVERVCNVVNVAAHFLCLGGQVGTDEIVVL